MDKREAILARLLAILDNIPDVITPAQLVVRNRGELPEDKRPAIVLLDGSEEVRISHSGRGGVLMTPAVMTLSPQIFVLLKPRQDAANTGVGEELSAFRVAVIKAIAQDQILAQLCGSNGQVILNRVETDMQTGSTLSGELRFDFAIDYTLDPNAL